jgi:hypothetical protein
LTLTVRGFGSIMRLISFLAPVENHGGQETLALVICKHNINIISVWIRRTSKVFLLQELTILYRVIKLGSSKGKYPAMRTNKIMPQDHTSAAIPS